MLNKILVRIVGLLPKKLQPYAKAVIPAAAATVTIGIHWAATGEFNAAEVRAAGEAAGIALLTVLFPNVG